MWYMAIALCLWSQDQRGWWFSQPNDYFKATDVSDTDKGFEESLALLRQTAALHGPFDGIMGFSQGAALAALICLMQEADKEEDFNFRFAILFAAFKSRSSRHAHWYVHQHDQICSSFDFKLSICDRYTGSKVRLPTLYVLGEDDKVIEKALSEELLPLFTQPTVVYHPGGHFVPATGKQKPQYLDFLNKMAAFS